MIAEKAKRDEIITVLNNLVVAIGTEEWDEAVEEGLYGSSIVEAIRYTGSDNLEVMVKQKHFTEGIHLLVQWAEVSEFEDNEFDPRPSNISAYCVIMAVSAYRDDPQGNLLEAETAIIDEVVKLEDVCVEPMTSARFAEYEDGSVMMMNILVRVDNIGN